MATIPNPLDDFLINPAMRLNIIMDQVITIPDDFDMMFDISKDLDEEPNSAEVIIYNLNESNRKKLITASHESAPIEIYLTRAGVDEEVLAFAGEIESCKNIPMRPGHETRLHCVCPKPHRMAFIDQKTYPKGTPKSLIILDFLQIMGIPKEQQSVLLPTDPILLSQSFSGPAFPLLRRFCYDSALYCYINDNIIHITSVYLPDDLVSRLIYKKYMLIPPEETTRKDSIDAELRTITEAKATNPLKAIRRKKTKNKKVVRGNPWWMRSQTVTPSPVPVNNEYVEFTAVDSDIPGMDFTLLLQPDLQPDKILMFPDYLDIATTMFRVREVQHYGDNFGGDWTTEARTDVYNPTGGDLLAGIT